MSRRLQLIVILCAVALMTTAISHSIDKWLKIENKSAVHWEIVLEGGKPSILLAGSSLAGDAIDWVRISKVLKLGIEGWGVAGSSPVEWEPFQNRAKGAKVTILGVSIYDLNEYILCDFRPQVVPVSQTIKDLWHSRADWAFSERVLGKYPLAYVRIFFPTAGRSEGVMVGIREKLRVMMKAMVNLESEAGPTLAFNDTGSVPETKTEKISQWDQGRMIRRIAAMRSGCQGKNAFNGPKKLAFLRMLQKASTHGAAMVVILPVSPMYEKEFLSPEVKKEFEESLSEAKEIVPDAQWIRLDRENALKSNDFFWDLVHMNVYGRQIATEVFLSKLKGSTHLR